MLHLDDIYVEALFFKHKLTTSYYAMTIHVFNGVPSEFVKTYVNTACGILHVLSAMLTLIADESNNCCQA